MKSKVNYRHADKYDSITKNSGVIIIFTDDSVEFTHGIAYSKEDLNDIIELLKTKREERI